MIELRPALVPGEAPLQLRFRPRMTLDASVRPLVRGAVLAAFLSAALGLPALRPLATGPAPAFGRTEAPAAGRASPRKDTMRVALVGEVSR